MSDEHKRGAGEEPEGFFDQREYPGVAAVKPEGFFDQREYPGVAAVKPEGFFDLRGHQRGTAGISQGELE